MPMQCNIDARGKVARLILGIIGILFGIILIFTWARPTHSIFAWGIAITVLIFGAFAIFEARAGWCVMRAMGFKTRI